MTDSRTRFVVSVYYVMVGAPGAGKGTQAALLSDRLGHPPPVASAISSVTTSSDGTALGQRGQGPI